MTKKLHSKSSSQKSPGKIVINVAHDGHEKEDNMKNADTRHNFMKETIANHVKYEHEHKNHEKEKTAEKHHLSEHHK